jgi:hypothetical protein
MAASRDAYIEELDALKGNYVRRVDTKLAELRKALSDAALQDRANFRRVLFEAGIAKTGIRNAEDAPEVISYWKRFINFYNANAKTALTRAVAEPNVSETVLSPEIDDGSSDAEVVGAVDETESESKFEVTRTGEDKGFPWWLLAVVAGIYFIGK